MLSFYCKHSFYFKKILQIILYVLISFNSYAETPSREFTLGHNIGVISVFPETTGMFYGNRAKAQNLWEQRRIFSEENVSFYEDVNQIIVDFLVDSLQSKFNENFKFIPLEYLETKEHLTGYAIEGWWGSATKYLYVNGLSRLFKEHSLDNIIAIVPCTYYLPLVDGEAAGLNISFIANSRQYFSSVYAVLLFSKSGKGYKKSYSSIKQVYYTGCKCIKCLNGRGYNQKHVDNFYKMLKEKFLPHLSRQVIGLLDHKKKIKSVFVEPIKPFLYYWPH